MDHELSKAASAQPPYIPSKSKTGCRSKLFVGGLLPETTESQLYNYFRKFGPILEVSICRNKRNHSKRFGYVTFACHSSARQVCRSQTHLIDHKILTVQLAFSHEELVDKHLRACGSKVYVFGSAVSNKPALHIYNLLSSLGPVKKVVKLKSKGQYLNSCFVTFGDENLARSLIQQKSLVLPNLQTILFKSFIPRLLRVNTALVPNHHSSSYSEYGRSVEFREQGSSSQDYVSTLKAARSEQIMRVRTEFREINSQARTNRTKDQVLAESLRQIQGTCTSASASPISVQGTQNTAAIRVKGFSPGESVANLRFNLSRTPLRYLDAYPLDTLEN